MNLSEANKKLQRYEYYDNQFEHMFGAHLLDYLAPVVIEPFDKDIESTSPKETFEILERNIKEAEYKARGNRDHPEHYTEEQVLWMAILKEKRLTHYRHVQINHAKNPRLNDDLDASCFNRYTMMREIPHVEECRKYLEYYDLAGKIKDLEKALGLDAKFPHNTSEELSAEQQKLLHFRQRARQIDNEIGITWKARRKKVKRDSQQGNSILATIMSGSLTKEEAQAMLFDSDPYEQIEKTRNAEWLKRKESREQCSTGKVRHITYSQAESHIKKFRAPKKTHQAQRVYKCDECNGFHTARRNKDKLDHKKRSERKLKNMRYGD